MNEYFHPANIEAERQARKERLKRLLFSSTGPNGQQSYLLGDALRRSIHRPSTYLGRFPHPVMRGKVRIG